LICILCLFVTKKTKRLGGCWMGFRRDKKQNWWAASISLGFNKRRYLFVTFRISDWRSLELMTFDKLEILDIWTTMILDFFLLESGINWCRFVFFIISVCKNYDESFPIRTKTVWCSISIPLIHCILFFTLI